MIIRSIPYNCMYMCMDTHTYIYIPIYILTHAHTRIYIYIHAALQACKNCSLRTRAKVLQSVLVRITNGKAIIDHCGNLWGLGGLCEHERCTNVNSFFTSVKNPRWECRTHTGCSLAFFVQLEAVCLEEEED